MATVLKDKRENNTPPDVFGDLLKAHGGYHTGSGRRYQAAPYT